MKKSTLLFIILFIGSLAMAQTKYQPTWESLDSRPIPEWYTNAKFGIFIHWGPYSVPAYSKVGEYAEWYWMNLANPEREENGYPETKEFHERVYSEHFTYPDFVPLFTAELFDSDQ